MDHKCDYCQSSFTTSRSLENHKKIAKYCLVLQGKNTDKYKCDGCQKTFSNNHWLFQHQCNCVPYQVDLKTRELQKEIQNLKIQNDNLQQMIKDLAEKAISKPTITNHTTNNTTNTTINNLHIITEDHIKNHAQHLTLEHIKKGAIGYSEYFLEYPLKERIACTDYSRRKIKYKNENGEIITDPEMSTLSDLLFKSIKERNRELTIQYTNDLTDKFKTAKDPTELSYFMEVAGKFSQQDLEVFHMFNGDKNDFFHDILRTICSKTLVQQ